MKRILALLAMLLPALPAHAVEVALGRGGFTTTASLTNVMRADLDLDITELSLSQPAARLGRLPLYWSARLDLFDSGFVNRVTDFASTPLRSDIPFLGGSIDDVAADYVPVPADYRIHGIDFNIDLGWPLLETPRGFISIGANTGITLPYMKTRNVKRDANVFLDLLETTSTEIRTYKLGPSLTARWALTPALTLDAHWLLNRQWGTLNNDLLGSGIDIEGSYHRLDLGLRLQPKQWPRGLGWLRHGYLAAGFSQTRWDHDRSSISIRQAAASVPSELDMRFSSTVFSLGVGVSF